MILQLLKFRFLKAMRSVSLGRKLVGGLFMALIGFIILSNIFALGLYLEPIIQKETGEENVIGVLNSFLLFFFLVEMIYRFFLQKVSVIELENFLHLPVGRSQIIHFLLISSFISTFNIITVLLFAPFAITEISIEYGTSGTLSWLFTVVGLSWSIHWFALWFKQKYSDQLAGVLAIFCILIAGITLQYYGIFNIGELLQPFLGWSLHSFIPLFITSTVFVISYLLAFSYYKKHAYIEDLSSRKEKRLAGTSVSLFNRFGLAGEIADLELKLILRHKRSRSFLGLSLMFLLYGLLFYGDFTGIQFMTIFLGVFITGIFIMNYGQLFLSWNSSHFDFFLSHKNGIHALITGKYLLFFGVSLLCFLLSIPYVYFGWEILFIHLAAFIFNIGINVHVIIYFSFWKPKPIDLGKGSAFNYEGMGAAQFLMAIPFVLLPYFIYLPFALLMNEATGLAAMGIAGLLGIFCYRQLLQIHINRLLNSKYNIASSFRSEL